MVSHLYISFLLRANNELNRINLNIGLDGRQQPAFIAKNQRDFNHGSALNIGVITGFISQRLQSPCNANSADIALAQKATAAATAAGGKSGAQ